MIENEYSDTPIDGLLLGSEPVEVPEAVVDYAIRRAYISAFMRSAEAFVGACRYPRLKNASLYEPAGIRGDGPMIAARYWGVTQQEYYERADVWPLNPKGEMIFGCTSARR